MGIGLREAENLTGLGRSSLQKAIKTGKLSATRASSGAWEVEVSELQRVYALKLPEPGLDQPRNEVSGPDIERDLLRQQLRMMEETVSDLRARLTRSDEERTRLTLMLTRDESGVRTSQAGGEKESEPATGWIIAALLIFLVALLLGVLFKVAKFLP